MFALHYVADHQAVEDIVQEAFVKLWQKEAKTPQAFLFTAVRNACIDQLRRQKNTSDAIELLSLPIHTDEEEQRAFREAKLWQIIEELPEQCRKIFLMNKRDGLRYKEIAEELGLSERTVEHQIAKAMNRLRGKRNELLFVLSLY